MEKDVGIPTTLFGGPPELGNLIKLGHSQNSFMNIFARPLFEAVTDVLPAMEFAVKEMTTNQEIWTRRIQLETAKQDLRATKVKGTLDTPLSPRSGSPNRSSSQPELSHPEGLPASLPLDSSPLTQAAQAADESRRASASSIPPHLAQHDGPDSSRRSSLNHFSNSTSYSRRSSGGYASPSQLQLAPTSDSGSRTVSSSATAENRQPNGRVSEDTLSQFSGTVLPPNESRRSSRGSVGGDISRRSSKCYNGDYLRSDRFAVPASVTATRHSSHSVHHRSSSGAHTNNTTVSQSTPYSPTETQATSVLTVDSDEKSSKSRGDGWTSPNRKGVPQMTSVERPNGATAGVKDNDVRTSVIENGSVRSAHSRAISRKASRSIFNFWKKRKSTEASP